MLRQMKTGTIILSVGYILIGLLLLVMPETSLQFLCFAFGAVILITGIVNLVRYFRISGRGLQAPFLLIGGVVAIGLGLFLLIKPVFVMSILPVVFGLFILFDGVIRILNAFELAKAHGQKWWMLLILGILSIVLGAIVAFHPFDALISVAMLCGIMLIVEGALNLGCVIYAAMELHALARMAEAALETLTADTPAPDAGKKDEDVVCDVEATVVDTPPEHGAGDGAPRQDGPDLHV